MNTLPSELVEEIFNTAELDELIVFCASSKTNRALCHNDALWKSVYRRYYSHCRKDNGQSYYETVRQCYKRERANHLQRREDRFQCLGTDCYCSHCMNYNYY